MKNAFRLTALTAALVASGAAMAATDTATMDVTLLVDSACAIQSVPSISLMGGSGNGWLYSSAGSIDVLCAPGVNYTVGVSGSQNGYGDPWQRRAYNSLAGTTLNYNLFNPYVGTLGDGYMTFSGSAIGASGAGGVQSFPIDVEAYFDYVPSGTYSDTLTVTVTY